MEDKVSIFKKNLDEKRELFLSNVRQPIQTLVKNLETTKTKITWDEYEQLHPMNSYEKFILKDHIDDKSLLKLTQLYLDNSSYPEYSKYELSRTYDDALIKEIVPLLAERLQESNNEIIKLREQIKNIENKV